MIAKTHTGKPMRSLCALLQSLNYLDEVTDWYA
jgi:hypothetical protein